MDEFQILMAFSFGGIALVIALDIVYDIRNRKRNTRLTACLTCSSLYWSTYDPLPQFDVCCEDCGDRLKEQYPSATKDWEYEKHGNDPGLCMTGGACESCEADDLKALDLAEAVQLFISDLNHLDSLTIADIIQMMENAPPCCWNCVHIAYCTERIDKPIGECAQDCQYCYGNAESLEDPCHHCAHEDILCSECPQHPGRVGEEGYVTLSMLLMIGNGFLYLYVGYLMLTCFF
jgi:hypothetical protein